MNEELFDCFFQKRLEQSLNDKLMYRSYTLDRETVIKYIEELINAPINDFICFVQEKCKVNYLSPDDVVQFSSFNDATKTICAVIKDSGDEGIKALEIGKLLENDGKVRTVGAYTKYGENHAKTAEELGLVHSMSSVFFLSCLGMVFNDLNEYQQEKLVARLILRNKLIQRLIQRVYSFGKANYIDEVGFLKQSTAIRRRSNVKYLFNLLEKEDEFISKITNKVYFN